MWRDALRRELSPKNAELGHNDWEIRVTLDAECRAVTSEAVRVMFGGSTTGNWVPLERPVVVF